MAYKPKGVMDIHEIIRRWHAGHHISSISRAMGIDRKTVRSYVRAAEQAGFSRTEALPPQDRLLSGLSGLVPRCEREKPARTELEPYREEILALVTQKTDPVKPKTAYEILLERHSEIGASYSSFKRLMREWQVASKRRTTCRFESDPGQEVQVDYAQVGKLFDPLTRRNRTVYAFIATLSFSRFKFIEFVFTQDQRSFVSSHIRMFLFFGGVVLSLVIDNLKSGVIKPHLYEPVFNPLYRQMADHYGCFIDSARVQSPQDKGKVERAVPLARELFRKLKALNPGLTLREANEKALAWCRFDNGLRVHGTTHEKPYETFLEHEEKALMPLPSEPFEMATWKEVKVHVDQYIQFEKVAYSVPQRYVGKTLWARGTEKLIQLFDSDFQLVKQYARSQRRQTDPADFPANVQVMLKEASVERLLERGAAIGPHMKAWVLRVLTPHAMRNYRTAMGVLRLSDNHPAGKMEDAAETALARRIFHYQGFKSLLARGVEETSIPVSVETEEMIRPPSYFINN